MHTHHACIHVVHTHTHAYTCTHTRASAGQIRAHKAAEEKKKKEHSNHQAKIKEQATQRQIEDLKAKLKAKSEL